MPNTMNASWKTQMADLQRPALEVCHLGLPTGVHGVGHLWYPLWVRLLPWGL